MNEISSARLAMAHVKKIPDEIQAKRKEDIDNLKHRLENTCTSMIALFILYLFRFFRMCLVCNR